MPVEYDSGSFNEQEQPHTKEGPEENEELWLEQDIEGLNPNPEPTESSEVEPSTTTIENSPILNPAQDLNDVPDQIEDEVIGVVFAIRSGPL
ncbi:hypothetical protein L1987_58455 [Smallanthus sonchifolius]|uniref:Uncharacterized protein n=1 Tax=Smallanthus sonchifolius TaxID=185202 RepID=A0ACB9DF99_9ASTR|nr:hypothetical protein L1987_58455 [Smallanthus sonchifolius]